MIISPIFIGDEVIGVIDVRNNTKGFEPYIKSIVELIASQIGQYSYLFDTIVKLKETVESLEYEKRNLELEKRQQTQTYEDFAHQLKSPTQQLKARASKYVDELKDSEQPTPKPILYLRGLSSKALRVTQSIKLFAELSKGKSITAKTSLLTENNLSKILIETAMDQANTTDPSLNIKFNVHREGCLLLKRAEVYADIDLLVQAISNLLDNAAKYSFPNTNVDISCDLIKKKNFHITVRNQGIPLIEVEKCKEREWRGEAKVIGEGSGIGLWIVDNIMKAHNGQLIIIATKNEITEVKLILPATTLN